LNLAYNATALLNKAICETKLNKNDEALRSLNQAIRMNPNYAKALVKRGEVNMVLKEYEEAVRDFNKASQLDSTGFGVQPKLKEAQKMAKAAKKKDYYGLLGIAKDANDQDIKKAFRKAARDWHPDKFSSKPEEERVKAEKMFKEINEANAVLSDPKKRQAYDQGADNLEDIERGGGMGGFGGMGGGIDPNDIFQMFMGGGGMGRGSRGRGQDPFGDMGGFNFGNMGGGGRGGNPGFTFRFQ